MFYLKNVKTLKTKQEFQKKLAANAVVYMNIDTVIRGNYSYEAAASPLLYDFIFDTIKEIKFTNNESAYDRWLKNNPNDDKTRP